MKIWQLSIIIALVVIAMLNPKLKLIKIFLTQFQVYKTDKTGKIYWFDIVTFLLIPITIGVLSSVFLPVSAVSMYSDTVITIFSLVATVLLSFVAILTDKNFKKQKQNELLKETNTSITTNIIYSMAVVMLVILPKVVYLSEIYKKIILGIIVFLIIKIAFCMLMILKRVFVIINLDSENKHQ